MYATPGATQPWTFKAESGRVRIFPDFSRRCPEVAPDDLVVRIGRGLESPRSMRRPVDDVLL